MSDNIQDVHEIFIISIFGGIWTSVEHENSNEIVGDLRFSKNINFSVNLILIFSTEPTYIARYLLLL